MKPSPPFSYDAWGAPLPEAYKRAVGGVSAAIAGLDQVSRILAELGAAEGAAEAAAVAQALEPFAKRLGALRSLIEETTPRLAEARIAENQRINDERGKREAEDAVDLMRRMRPKD